MAMDWREHIEINPEILVGKPILRGTRLAVDLILELLAAGAGFEQLADDYPGLTRDQVRACMAYAAEVIRGERVLPLAV